MNAETELMLMFAARIEHVNKVIQPALQAGTWVVSDRFYDASYAYQGYGRSVNLNRIDILRKFSIGDLEPDLTILLDATLDVSMQRVTERGNQDRFENEHSNFYEKVRRGYLQLAKQNQQRICVIDTNQSISLVQEAIKSKINRLTESK